MNLYNFWRYLNDCLQLDLVELMKVLMILEVVEGHYWSSGDWMMPPEETRNHLERRNWRQAIGQSLMNMFMHIKGYELSYGLAITQYQLER